MAPLDPPRPPDPAGTIRLRHGAHAAEPRPAGPPAHELDSLPSVAGYEVLRKLGRGGMGVVYLARQISLNRVVALKMVPGGALADAERRTRFRREAEAVAALQHPNIIQIFEVGVWNGCPYLAREYVEGGTLAQHLDGPMPPRVAAALARSLAAAVHYAHEHGIVHRDLKPANVLLSAGEAALLAPGVEGARPGLPFVPKIADFGLAKRIEDGDAPTITGTTLGTPEYMAPEQAACRKDAGPPADVWSLGVLLYQALTGCRPFVGETPWQVLLSVQHREPAAPSRLVRSLPRDLEVICLKCLRKEPSDRYATAYALAEDLRRFLADEPIAARPRRLGERLLDWRRRHPVVANLLAGIVLVTLAGGTAVTMAWRDAVREREKARLQAANLFLDEGVRLAEAGDADKGLHLMLAALENAPPGDPLAGVIRVNLAAWSAHAHALADVLSFGETVSKSTLSPDGGLLAVSTGYGRLHLLETATRRPLCEPFTFPGAAVSCAAFGADGRSLWFGTAYDPVRRSGECRIYRYDIATGRLGVDWRLPSLPGESEAENPRWLRPREDGTLLVWAWGRPVEVLDATTGRPARPPLPIARSARGVAVRPDGRVLAVVSGGNHGEPSPALRLWNLDTGQPETEAIPCPGQQRVWSVAWTPDGNGLVTTHHGSAQLWDVGHGTVTPRGRLLPHPDLVQNASFTPDGRWLLTSGGDGCGRIWDVHAQRLRPPLLRHSGQLYDVKVTPDGRHALTSSADGTLRVWLMSRDGVRPPALPGAPGPRLTFDKALFRPDCAAAVFTCHNDYPALARLAEVGGMPVGRPLRHLWPNVRAAAFSPDLRRLVTSSIDQWALGNRPGTGRSAIHLWDARTGEELATPWETGPRRNWPAALAFSPDSREFASGDFWHQVQRWRADNGGLIASLPNAGDIVLAAAYAPDGKTLAVGTALDRNGVPRVQRYELESGRMLPDLPQRSNVDFVTYSPDGRRLLAGSWDRKRAGAEEHHLYLYDAATGARLGQPMPQPQGFVAAAFRADGARLLTGSRDGTARLWDAETAAPVGRTMAHPAVVTCVAISKAGRLAVGCADGTSRIWDAATGKPLGPPLPQRGAILALAFSDDGEDLFAADDTGTVRCWRLPPPLTDNFGDLQRVISSRTGLALDATRVVTPVTMGAWHPAPGAPPALGQAAWHDSQARDAEQDRDAAGALYHLEALLALAKGDGALHARRGRALALAGEWGKAGEAYDEAERLLGVARMAAWYDHEAVACEAAGAASLVAWYLDRFALARSGPTNSPK